MSTIPGLPLSGSVRVLIAAKPVDFRKGADGLAALAKEVLAQDPFSGAIIVFRAKRADRVKILVWDGSGLVLVWKRLEEGALPIRLSPTATSGSVGPCSWTFTWQSSVPTIAP